MKSKKKAVSRSLSSPSYLLPSEGSVSREQKLLIIALQLPQVTNLFDAISYSRRLCALQRRWAVWKFASDRIGERLAAENAKRKSCVILVQSLARSYISRRRIARRRALELQKENEQRAAAALRIQCFARKVSAIRRVKEVRARNPLLRREAAARLIQRVFRGLLGRAIVLNMERRKLLRFLRFWSRGKTNNLFHISVLQEVEAQALLFTAISFAMLPSKPIRLLPSLAKFRHYRAGVMALYWQLQNRFTARKDEARRRKAEKRMMGYEDLYSHAYETVMKAKILKQKQQAEIEHQYKLAQQREAERRREFLAAQSMMNLHNKQMAREREEKEGSWRHNEALQREIKWIEMVLRRESEREWELMKAEDGRAHVLRSQDIETSARKQTLKQQTNLVVSTKLDSWKQQKFIESRRMRSCLTESTLRTQVEHFDSFLADSIERFFNSLCLGDVFQSKLSHWFADRKTSTGRTAQVSSTLLSLLQECNFSYRLVQSRLLQWRAWYRRPLHNPLPLPKLLHYLTEMASQDDASNSILQVVKDRQFIESMPGIPIRADIWKVDVISQSVELQKNIQMSVRMQMSSQVIALYAVLIEYKFLKHRNRSIFRTLSQDLGAFRQKHQTLRALRKEMKEDKLLRSDRKAKLTLAAAVEKELFALRLRIIEQGTFLVESVFFEIRLFLDLFYPTENNYCYRQENASSAFQHAQARRRESSASITETPPMGTPTRRRSSTIYRHSLDGSPVASSINLALSPTEHGTATIARRLDDELADASGGDASSDAKSSGNPQDPSLTSSNRSKGKKGSARANHRRRSLGSKPENPFGSTNNLKGAGGSTSSSTGGKIRLTARKFNPFADDCEDYWQDLLAVAAEAFSLPSLELIAFLPAPPRPAVHHDGLRHIPKLKGILSHQSKYHGSQPSSSAGKKKESGNKRATRSAGGVGFASDTGSQGSSSGAKKGKGHIRWAKKKEVFTPSNVQAKERKFFDIPGENAFMEADVEKYDFFSWGRKLLLWSHDVFGHNHTLAERWKHHSHRELEALLLAGRMHYLLQVDEAGTTPSEAQQEQVLLQCQRLIESTRVGVEDFLDLYLSSYDIVITAHMPSSELASPHKGPALNVNTLSELSLRLSAPELDHLLHRQPCSIVAREMLRNEVYGWFGRYFSIFPHHLLPSRDAILSDFRSNALFPTLDPIMQKLWDHELEIYPVLAKENRELEEAARLLLRNRCVVFDVQQRRLSVQYPERNQTLGVTIYQNAETCRAVFPMFMQPVYHFGQAAGPEPFHKQLLRELKSGIAGKFSRWNALDNRVDKYARLFVRAIRKRILLRRFLVHCWQEHETSKANLQLMALEDARSLLVRRDEKVAARALLAQQFGYRARRALLGCFSCGVWQEPKVFPGDELFRIADAEQVVKRSKSVIRSYGNTKFGPIGPHEWTLFQQLMVAICENCYRIRSGPMQEKINKLLQQHPMVSTVEDQLWGALEDDLKYIDSIVEQTCVRLTSWSTGQTVSLNLNTGGHMSMQELLLLHGKDMATLHGTLTSSSTLVSPVNDYSWRRTASRVIPEIWIAGGMQRLVAAMRIVENAKVNERGVFIVEDMDLSPAKLSGVSSIAGSFGWRRSTVEQTPNADGFPPRKLNPLIYDEQSVSLIARTGFVYQPLCHCCKWSAVPSTVTPIAADSFQTIQHRFYQYSHLARLQDHHLGETALIQSEERQRRQEAMTTRPTDFPSLQPLAPELTGTTKEKITVLNAVSLSTPETMRWDLLRLVLHHRYEGLVGGRQTLYGELWVHFQAIVRGKIVRMRMKRANRSSL